MPAIRSWTLPKYKRRAAGSICSLEPLKALMVMPLTFTVPVSETWRSPSLTKQSAIAVTAPNSSFSVQSRTSTSRPAGVASTLPPASVARAWIVWWPGASSGVVYAASHAAHALSSTLHSKCERARLEDTAYAIERCLIEPSGPSSDVSGAVAASFISRVAVPVLPAPSVARTTTEYWPLARSGVLHGDVQVCGSPLSVAHVKATPSSGEENVTAARVSSSLASSTPSIDTCGATVSTVNERNALSATPRTRNTCPPSLSSGAV